MNHYFKSLKTVSESFTKMSSFNEVVKWRNKTLEILKKSENFVDSTCENMENLLGSFRKTKGQFLKSIGYEVVYLSDKELKLGFENLRKRLSEIATEKAISASLSMVFSSIWPVISETPLLQSPISMAAISIGGGFILNRTLEEKNIKKYARLSVLSSLNGPSIHKEENEKIQKIMAGENPNIHLTSRGLEIYGPLGDLLDPSFKRKETKSSILSMEEVVIPRCVLGKNAAPLIGLLKEHRISTAMLPFSFFYLMKTFAQESKDRTGFDYGASFVSGYNLYHYFTAPPISEIRKKISEFLNRGKTPQEILKLLIDGNDLQEGMSFLQSWVEDADTIGVAIDWKGDLILYKNEKAPFLVNELYPAQSFPKENVSGKEEGNKAINEERLLYVLSALMLASSGIIFLGKKRKQTT